MERRKRIAFLGNSLTSRYRRGLCRSFNIAAEEKNVDMVYFNSMGRIGIVDDVFGNYDAELLDYIDLDQFDGIIYDGEGYFENGIEDLFVKRLRAVKCPVVSISNHVDGFYNIEFNDAGGIQAMVEHFIECHHFTKIGYMSGFYAHPDALVRLAEFRSVMKKYGLPEDGIGVFEGDFWYKKGGEAADFFLSRTERPEAIVCANDFMAMSLINALKQRGIRVPEDIAVSGYDGTMEGREYLPHLTSVSRERLDIARKAIGLLVDLADNKVVSTNDLRVTPKTIISQSCGCDPLDYQHVLEIITRLHEEIRLDNIAVFDAETSILRLNKVNTVREIESVFAGSALDFGEYRSFFMMIHADSSGCPAYDSDYISPSGNFIPIIWIDKNKEYINSPHHFSSSFIIPSTESDRCHIYYVMGVNCVDKMFGYSVVEMTNKDIFNEFYNVWNLNIALTLNYLQKNNHINKLINKLENLSIRDGLTGMLNRRGFDELSRNLISGLRDTTVACTMVIDMDGLKRINDEYGHHEGDRAIKALADMITDCCDSGEIAGRAGGDEFYVFAIDYSEAKLERFLRRMHTKAEGFNLHNKAGYMLDFSCGAHIVETDRNGLIEEFLKISDSKMYEQKQSKPGRTKRS